MEVIRAINGGKLTIKYRRNTEMITAYKRILCSDVSASGEFE
jgi:hypothetical protein